MGNRNGAIFDSQRYFPTPVMQMAVFTDGPSRTRTCDQSIMRGAQMLFAESIFGDLPRDFVVWGCTQFAIIPAFCLRTMAREWRKWIDYSFTVSPHGIRSKCLESILGSVELAGPVNQLCHLTYATAIASRYCDFILSKFGVSGKPGVVRIL